ncbi:MAG: hypothetical protein KatS3mg031_2034 [Chitinophagales bacterium]|nr:MAG: hypothetical protein KatS3mg031_2034 [Chitinophagales bacterium]
MISGTRGRCCLIMLSTGFTLIIGLTSCAQQHQEPVRNFQSGRGSMDTIAIDTATLNARLTAAQYEVICNKVTEPPFTGRYWNFKGDGVYRCARCRQVLFDSKDKYDSGSGWPSFVQPADPHTVQEQEDNSYGMRRTEIICSRCGAHLGHVFTDGPRPTGLRYCVNSLSLEFEERKQ